MQLLKTRKSILEASVVCTLALVALVPRLVFASWFSDGLFLFGNWMIGNLGSLMISLNVFILTFAGMIFDLLIKFTIVDFASVMSTLHIIDGVETVWAAFRDIANIVIIGMFVFVALATILGVEEYGIKKMVARLLLVAILINFSLFFTQFIIDTSHIFAKQFYDSVVENVDTSSQSISAATQTDGTDGVSATISGGISSSFMQRAGLVGGFDTVEQIKTIGTKSENLIVPLIYSVMISLFMFTVAVIFLYGSFLLASRAILLIVLMLTSSLAFASYLIPKFSNHKYGWSGWWNSLLKSAVMAPLLMMFLWASLVVLRGGDSGGVTLGQFLSDPTNEKGWPVFFTFVFVIGMLFISIKLSQALSGQVEGFKLSARIPGLATVGAALGGAMLARSLAGRAATRTQDRLERRAQHLTEQGKHGAAARSRWAARRMGTVARSDLNVMNTKLGKFVADASGLKGKLAGTSKGSGFAGREDKRAEFYAKEAAATNPKDDVRDRIIEEERKKRAPEISRSDSELSAAENDLQGAQESRTQVAKEYQNRIDEIERELASSVTEERAAELRAARQQADSQHESVLRSQDENIRNARERIKGLRKQRSNFEDYIKAEADVRMKNEYKHLETDEIAAQRAYQSPLHWFSRAVGTMRGEEIKSDGYALVQKARKQVTKQAKNKRFRDAFEEQIKDVTKEQQSQQPPPQAPTN